MVFYVAVSGQTTEGERTNFSSLALRGGLPLREQTQTSRATDIFLSHQLQLDDPCSEGAGYIRGQRTLHTYNVILSDLAGRVAEKDGTCL
jgi:hypothetical protein